MGTLVLPLLLAVAQGPSPSQRVPISSSECGRMYEGIGGLLNSDAPWLRAYPQQQLSDILDILFLPKFAGALQVLKLEVGGECVLSVIFAIFFGLFHLWMVTNAFAIAFAIV